MHIRANSELDNCAIRVGAEWKLESSCMDLHALEGSTGEWNYMCAY